GSEGQAAVRRRRIRESAAAASSRERAIRPRSDRVGVSAIATPTAVTEVGSPAAGVRGLSVTTVVSLVPSPLESYITAPWLVIAEPAVPELTVAVMVIVTVPPAGIGPSQVTVSVATVATAVPE